MSQTIRQHPIDTTPVMFLTERVMRELLTTGIIHSHEPHGQVCRQVNLKELRIVIGKALAIARRNGINERTDS